jgi:hypothetical protein
MRLACPGRFCTHANEHSCLGLDLHAPHHGRMVTRCSEPGSRSGAYRSVLIGEDLTMRVTRRKTHFGLAAIIAVLALAGWVLSYFG